MANSRCLIDTSIIIDHLRKTKKVKTHLWNIAQTNDMFLSTISLFELYAGATTKEKESDVHKILASFQILNVTSDVAHAASQLYQTLKQSNQVIAVGDLFIAATALVAHIPIATLNLKHFTRIPELEIVRLS